MLVSSVPPKSPLIKKVSTWLRRALVLACFAPTTASAHFLYCTTESSSDTQTAVVFFSEAAQTAGGHLPDKIAKAEAWWRDADGRRVALAMQRSEQRPTLEARLTQGPGSLEVSCTYGVYKSAFLLHYCSKFVHHENDDQLALLSRTPEFPIDASLKRTGKSIEVKAYRGNEILPKASVTWTDPAGNSVEQQTDEQGVARFELQGPGLHSARVHYIDKSVQGEHDGQKYSEAQYFTTASIQVSGSALEAPAIPALPQPTSSFGGAVLDEWLYVYSGHTGKEHAHSKDNLSSRFIRCRLSTTEPSAWEELPMRTALQGLALVAHQGQLYRVGGLSARNTSEQPADLHSVTDVERFDPTTKVWSKAQPLPQARSSHDAVVLNDRLYVVGGWNLSGGREGDWLADALVFDLTTPNATWEPISQPFRRRALAAAAFDNKLYVIGGMDEDHNISRSVDIWDPATKQWSQGPELPGEGMQGFGVSAWAHDSTLYVSGSNGEVYKLRPGDLHWYRHASLRTGRFFHRLLPASTLGLIAVGGASVEQKTHLDDTEFVPFLIPSLNASNDEAPHVAK